MHSRDTAAWDRTRLWRERATENVTAGIVVATVAREVPADRRRPAHCSGLEGGLGLSSGSHRQPLTVPYHPSITLAFLMPRKRAATVRNASKDAQAIAGPAHVGRRRNVRGRKGGLKDMPNMPFDILLEVRKAALF